MSTNVDPAVANLLDLLLAVSDALAGMDDRRAVAARVAITRVYAGTDDPGAAADWLREFLAVEAERRQRSRRPIPLGGDGRDPQTDWLTAAERACMTESSP